jgi:hypothetical protein
VVAIALSVVALTMLRDVRPGREAEAAADDGASIFTERELSRG